MTARGRPLGAKDKKPRKGTARPGAGRPKGRKFEARNISLPIEVWERVDRESAVTGMTKSAVVAAAIGAFFQNEDDDNREAPLN